MFTQYQYRFWLPIPSEIHEGVFINKEEILEHDIQRVVYIFENESETFAIRGSPPFNEQMDLVHINDRVRIEYLGIRTASDSVRYPAYRLWKNSWTALADAEEYDEDGILLL